MAKKSKKEREKKKPAEPGLLAKWDERYPNGKYVLLLVILIAILFNEVLFGGKTLIPPDALAARSYRPFVQDALKRGIYPLWNPYIFSGMPSFASLAAAPFVDIVGSVLNGIAWILERIFPMPPFIRIFFNYILFGVFSYILFLNQAKVRVIAVVASAALIFQPAIVAFPAFGHNTKLTTALMIPVIFLLVEELLEKRRWLHWALLALAVGLQLLRAHVQMAYYTWMLIGLFALYWSIDRFLQSKSLAEVAKSLSMLAAALAVGLAMSSWLYLSVQEYSHYSIRGGGKGLDYGYATSWSFSPLEVLTFFVPSFVGFGGPTYWGKMPFTDFPFYMGIVLLFLAGLALVLERKRTTLFMGLLGLFALLVSFGKEFPLIYNLLFKYLPYFSKFRVPSMILILLQFSTVFLAARALTLLWDAVQGNRVDAIRRKVQKYSIIFGGFCALLFLYLLLGKGSLIGAMAASGKVLNPQLQAQSYRMAVMDGLLMVLMVAILLVLLSLVGKKAIRPSTFVWFVGALILFDLWRIDFRIIQPKPRASETAFFRADEVVQFLKKDKSLYRILPVLDERPPNWYMYHFIQNVYGYHAAKIKIYQEMLEETGFPRSFLLKYYKPVVQNGQQTFAHRAPDEMDPSLWRLHENVLRMLNVKYIITPFAFQDSSYTLVYRGRKNVFRHVTALPRAWFVDQIKVVASKEEVFQRLRSPDFDPAHEALLYETPDVQPAGAGGNRVEVVNWDIQKIEISVEAKKPGFLVLSEVFYPAGWEAKLDGRPVRIYQTNHILRGLVIPEGKHQLVLEFRPGAFRLGLLITAGTILGCLLLVGGALLSERRRRKAEPERNLQV